MPNSTHHIVSCLYANVTENLVTIYEIQYNTVVWSVYHFPVLFSAVFLVQVFYLCLTMSAELMKSKFVHRPSVRRPSVASIISEVIAWISLKF